MHDFAMRSTRRDFARAAIATGAFFTVPGLFAEQLALTPHATEGPYYPDTLPLDSDNDLILVNDSATPALGQVAHVSGTVLTPSGEPVRNATVEIWQVDANGIYLHSGAPGHESRDANFQGFGQFETDSTGEYRFRTIQPVPYDGFMGRIPHIHYAVNRNGHRVLTTQLFVKGHERDEQDGVVRQLVRSGRDFDSLYVDFEPIPGSKVGEVAATFDLVIGEGPEQSRSPRGRRGRYGRLGRRG